jgi:hypothetical protein
MFSDGTTGAMSHNTKEFDSPVFSDLIHIKIMSPWFIQEKTGCEFQWNSPWWNNVSQHNKFFIPPGIVEYKYQHRSNINMFINKSPSNFMIAAGTPLVHIVPLSDKDVQIKCHYLPQEEYNKKFYAHQMKFVGSFKEKKKIAKSKESKCPFGFGK